MLDPEERDNPKASQEVRDEDIRRASQQEVEELHDNRALLSRREKKQAEKIARMVGKAASKNRPMVIAPANNTIKAVLGIGKTRSYSPAIYKRARQLVRESSEGDADFDVIYPVGEQLQPEPDALKIRRRIPELDELNRHQANTE